MPDTGKIKPEVTERGLFMPWLLVVSLLFALLVSGIIPLWIFAVNAMHVADRVDAVIESDRAQDKSIIELRERVAKQEARP